MCVHTHVWVKIEIMTIGIRCSFFAEHGKLYRMFVKVGFYSPGY